MQAEDIELVLDAEQRIYAFPWTRGNFEDSLASGYTARLMRDGNQLVGYAVMMLILDEAHLLNISIVSGRQQAGLGSLLLESMCEEARSLGAQRMVLEVRQSNVAGRAFYDRHGFAQIGVRTDYYPAEQGRESALVLEKIL
ncbi:MAG: ribosomal protein S18-alanine N-acetyltransferase [Proteobacteria bacterium]|nr:ribosomal protein S18-alanine N-acetyltransferase [Pseudomonadota bacterium]